MSDLFRLLEVIKLFMIGGCLLTIAFLVLLALTRCRLRELLLGLLKLVFVAICLAYAFSSMDLMPQSLFGSFGLLDDAVAVGLGIIAASSAVTDFKAPVRAGGRRAGEIRSTWVDEPFDL